ncbi:MAG: DUF2950 domain-containing protein [Desulfuromusa sp.]|nr:DUF2950 domain-containing protein [Desulfuromusa sp.]
MILFIPRITQMPRHEGQIHRALHFLCGAMAILIAIIALSAAPGWAAEQAIFPSPQQAVSALVNAIKNDNDVELINILGSTAEGLVSSGDKVADQNGKARFLKAYGEKYSFEQEDSGKVTLLIGDKSYPFPIPLVQQGDTWFFDTQSGMEEILNRRIGRNELHTIQVMQAYTNAQREYACLIRDDGPPTFAQKLASTEGKKDGLYWETETGERESPLGPLVAKAVKKGYMAGLNENTDTPFRGYLYKILKSQGKHANGGAFDYIIDDKMILGFALVAYPAKYGASGIMTFIVNQEGLVYEKDLGAKTSILAAAMTTFDPDSTWEKYLDPADQ